LLRDYRAEKGHDWSGLKYFTLCGEKAADIRYLQSKGILARSVTPGGCIAYCESIPKYYEVLKSAWPALQGFEGRLEDIATNPSDRQYGTFWSLFPFHILNLDFLGDIHNPLCHEAIDRMVQAQAKSAEQYELWITMRVHRRRVPPSLKDQYEKLLNHNLSRNAEFAKRASSRFTLKDIRVHNPDAESLVCVAFGKWLRYVIKRYYCSVDEDNSVLVHYSRDGKERNQYRMYEFMLRVVPYDLKGEIPSPVSRACETSERNYGTSVLKCLDTGVDADAQVKRLSARVRRELEEEMRATDAEFKASAQYSLSSPRVKK
jgi:hypothetical protein